MDRIEIQVTVTPDGPKHDLVGVRLEQLIVLLEDVTVEIATRRGWRPSAVLGSLLQTLPDN